MSGLEEIIKEVYQRELDNNCYDYEIFDINFFRFFRFEYRISFLKRKKVFNNKSKVDDITFWVLLKNSFQILLQFFTFLVSFFSFRKKNVFFGYPRLQEHDSFLVDKFTEPFISLNNLEDKSVIMQRRSGGRILDNRKPDIDVFGIDFIEFLSLFFGVPLMLLFLFKIKTLKSFRESIFKTYGFSPSLIKLCFKLSQNLVSISIFYFCLKLLKCKRVFVVSREVFFPVIIAAHKLDIIVFEFQHGITRGETPYYYGKYDTLIDPDFILSFDSNALPKYFGYESDTNIIYIGNLWLNYLSKLNFKRKSNSVIVISSPNDSEKIFQFLKSIHIDFYNFEFFIRLHPQEGWSSDKISFINETSNIQFDECRCDAAIEVQKHEFVLGIKSTVLFEAIDMNCKVGFLGLKDLNMDISYLSGESFNQNKIEDFQALQSFLGGDRIINNENSFVELSHENMSNILN